MKQRVKEDLFFYLFFPAAIIVIFWDLIILKSGFINGDYAQQFLPWCKLYADSLRNFQLPLWIKEGQCGFPLFAEGQIGALYPLNILFFGLLPFKFAYNYSFLLHFTLSGIFTYFFARKLKADVWGAALAAVLLCFGSVYAGCFVNVSALKALTWFPLLFLLVERYLKDKRPGWVFLSGLLVGVQFLAGSIQMAFYSAAFFMLYFIYRSYGEKISVWLVTKNVFIISLVSFLVSLPQLAVTYELSSYSNRAGSNLGFALWNSFSPLAFLGTVFPSLGAPFARGDFMYIGVLGLFLALTAAFYLRSEKRVAALILMFFVALLLALGKFNPLYTFLIKVFKFYSFRSPSRFIYFGIFALSILAGKGFTYLFENKSRVAKSVYIFFIGILFLALSALFSAAAILKIWGPRMLDIAKEYVQNNIFGATHHRYSLEVYMAKTDSIYYSLIERFSLRDPYSLAGFIVILASIVILFVLMRAKRQGRYLKFLCLGFIIVDLFVFSFFAKGLRPDIAGYNSIYPQEEKIFNILKDDKELFRVMPFGDMNKIPLWAKSSMNAFYGLDSAAFYSPLANKDYYEAVKGLGIVDDSLGIVSPLAEDLASKLDLLRSLNVKYIISAGKLDMRGLSFAARQGGIYLYLLTGYLPRFVFNPQENRRGFLISGLKLNEFRSGYAKVSLNSSEDGTLVFSEKFYPGWEAYVDGRRVLIEPFKGILQSIKVGSGKHEVVFEFEPRYLRPLLLLQSLVFILVLLFCLVNINSVKKPGATQR